MAVASYPFPARNPAYPNVEDVLFSNAIPRESPRYAGLYARADGDEARMLRLQYLTVEEELERAFRFVSPCDENASTFSFKFAEIIRSAANVYEIFCKTLYARLYNDTDELNVFNYLALDSHLQLASKRVVQLAAFGSFAGHPEISQPFVALQPWDRTSEVRRDHVPSWWRAYNGIKHSNEGLKDHATLANSMASVAAVFLLVERVFGFGILNGGLYNASARTIVSRPRWSRLFANS